MEYIEPFIVGLNGPIKEQDWMDLVNSDPELKLVSKEGCTGTNPMTGEEVIIPGQDVAVFLSDECPGDIARYIDGEIAIVDEAQFYEGIKMEKAVEIAKKLNGKIVEKYDDESM